jgi:hypothetical protein
MRKRHSAKPRRRTRARKGGGSIAHIVGAWITHYGDTGQVKAYVRWQDTRGKEGTTEGSPNSAHMQALLDRAIRSGVRIKHSTSGAIWDPRLLEPGEGHRVVPPSEAVPARFGASRRRGHARKRELTVFERHQLKIARDSLRMPDAMLGVMGGPSKAEAREIIKRLTGKEPKE